MWRIGLRITLISIFILLGTLFTALTPTPVIAQTYPACYVATNTPTPTPSVPFPSVVTPTPITPVCNQTGSGNFFACYYDNINFTNLQVTRTETVTPISGGSSWGNSWGNGSPAAGIAVDTFSATYLGTFNFASAGTYRFTAVSDDGIRVYVDNNQVIFAWVDQAPTTYITNYSLAAGNHTIRVEYYENTGAAQASLSWCNIAICSSPTNTPTPTPTPTPTSTIPTNTPTPTSAAPSATPSCSISGPSSLSIGQSGSYSANCSNTSGSPSVGIYWTPTSSESWLLVGSECSNTSSCTQTAVFNSPGTYYVVVNGYKNPGASDANTRCTGNPFGIAPGWSNCGGGDYVIVTVSAPSVSLSISSIHVTGTALPGYYNILSPSDTTGTSSGFTTNTYSLISGISYTVGMQDYGGYVFDHWQDTSSTDRNRVVNINVNSSITAVYNGGAADPTPDPGGGGGGNECGPIGGVVLQAWNQCDDASHSCYAYCTAPCGTLSPYSCTTCSGTSYYCNYDANAYAQCQAQC